MDKRRLILNTFSLLVTLILLGGCEPLFVSVDPGSTGTNAATADDSSGEVEVLTFSGVDSISTIGSTTATINWTHISDAASYEVYDVTSGETFIASVTAPTAVYNITGLTAGSSYDFRVRAKNNVGTIDTNTNKETFVTLLTFSGIDSIASIAATTATINWTHITGASSYEVYDVTGASNFIASVTAPTTSYNLTGLSASTTTQYRVRAKNSAASEDTNVVDVSLTTLPVAPSGIVLATPLVTPGLDSTLEVTVSGVKNGDTVKLFSDSGCTTQVGSASSTGATVQITTSALAIASHTFYANTADANISECSTANITYEYLACPTGYVLVPASSVVGTTDNFCVMKYEAKNDGSDNPTSTEGTTPWINIPQATARTECQSLNALNSVTDKYDLISNPEWMTIARNLEDVPANWTNNAVGSGCLKRGNVGGTLGCTGGNSGYSNGAIDFGAGRSTTAEMTLDNGETVWDISGNVWEWVNWSLDFNSLYGNMAKMDKPYVTGDAGPVTAWREVSALNVFSVVSPNTSVLPSNVTYDSTEGIGQYQGHLSDGIGAPTRGGRYTEGGNAGIYALQLYGNPTNGTGTGFRCVFRQ